MSSRNRIGDNTRLGLAFWMLCLYFGFEYVRPQDMLPALAPLRIPLMLTLLMPLLWLVKGDKRVIKDPLVILYGLFIGLCAMSFLWAANHYWVVETTKYLTAFLIGGLVPAAGLLQDRRRLSAFFTLWVVIHVFVAGVSLANRGRGTGSFLVDENDMSLAINMAIPYAYFLLQSSTRGTLYKTCMVAAIGIMLAAVIYSGSRGGFLGLAAIVVGILFFAKYKLRNTLVIAVFGLVAFLNLPEGYVDEMQTISDAGDVTRNERLYSWGLGWDMFLDNPVAGVAAANYPWRVHEYEAMRGEYRDSRSLGGRVSHSLYFTLIPELGLLGIILFGSMAVIGFNRLRAVIRREDRFAVASGKRIAPPTEAGLLARAMLVSMIGLFTSGAFISVLYYPHFWYLLGFVLALQYATATATAPVRSSSLQRAGAPALGGGLAGQQPR